MSDHAHPAGTPRAFTVPLAGRSAGAAAGESTLALQYDGHDPRAILVLAHGAGAGQRHPFMTAIATGLAGRGVTVVTFDFPYMHAGRKLPDRAPVLEACFAAVVGAVRETPGLGARPLFVGGKSMGGRMATHLGASRVTDAAGIVALGYPLHPPGKPLQLRTAHLPAIAWPVLIVQGSRDAFGTPDELRPVLSSMQGRPTLHVVDGGDHSFAVRGAKKEVVYDGIVEAVARWISQRT